MKYDVCEITTIHPQDDGRVLRSINAIAEHYGRTAFISPWKSNDNLDPKVDLFTIALSEKRSARIWHGIRVFRRALGINTSVYHFHDLDFLIFAVLLKILKRKPVIYDCHENYPEEILYNKLWIPSILRKPVSNLVRFLEDSSVKYLNNIIVVTPAQEGRFSKVAAHVSLVRNFSDISIDRSKNGDSIIYTGGLGKTYGLHQLLEIAKRLKAHGIRILITDRFSSASEERYFKEQVRENSLDITFLRKVPASEMGGLLKMACLGLSPSQVAPNTKLGYHSKLIEYMACGLPIVASNVNANTFVLSKVECGIIVEPEDIDAYIAAILKIYSNPNIRETMREHGFKAIAEEFNWKVEKYQLLKALGSAT